jgi:ribosomal-protein-alanine N-acetyltransferase
MEIEQQSFQNPWNSQLMEDLVVASKGELISFHVALCDEQVIAYAIGEMAGHELHLTNLAVSRLSRNRGIGRSLTGDLEAWGGDRGAEEVWLEVREHNTIAIGFYRNLGYRIRGRRKAYYRDPEEDALLMSKPLVASND